MNIEIYDTLYHLKPKRSVWFVPARIEYLLRRCMLGRVIGVRYALRSIECKSKSRLEVRKMDMCKLLLSNA